MTASVDTYEWMTGLSKIGVGRSARKETCQQHGDSIEVCHMKKELKCGLR